MVGKAAVPSGILYAVESMQERLCIRTRSQAVSTLDWLNFFPAYVSYAGFSAKACIRLSQIYDPVGMISASLGSLKPGG